jgi:hypothetical protein
MYNEIPVKNIVRPLPRVACRTGCGMYFSALGFEYSIFDFACKGLFLPLCLSAYF